MKPSCHVRVVRNPKDRAAAFDIRLQVFHREQGIPPEEEFDADDEVATHVLATCAGLPVGTGRLVGHDGFAKIGRMAVLAEHRRSGVGRALLRKLIELGRRHGHNRFVLHAQVQAIPFYEGLGFRSIGAVFDEAGIPHRKMERRLGKGRSAAERKRT